VITNALLSPSWAGPELAVCGFTPRSVEGPDAVANTTQVHGNTVHVVALTRDGAAPPPPAEGDGLWTASPGLPIAIRVADCVPILLWDPAVPAVAAVHAGWRGTVADIVGEALRIGATELGVSPARVRAAIGPCISGRRFEVGPEVVAGLRALGLPDATFGLHTSPRGRPHVDLRGANRALLVRAGVPDAFIEDVGGCTFDDAERFHSWRRDGLAAGRMRGIIGIRA